MRVADVSCVGGLCEDTDGEVEMKILLCRWISDDEVGL